MKEIAEVQMNQSGKWGSSNGQPAGELFFPVSFVF